MIDIISVRSKYDKECRDDEWYNAITAEMDVWLKKDWRKILRKGYVEGTYMMFNDTGHEGSYAIRFPGATRGHVRVDENSIITNIILYEETKDIYKVVLERKYLKQFIGMRLVNPLKEPDSTGNIKVPDEPVEH